MRDEYYALPLRFGDLMQKKDHAKCSLLQSVAQNIHLMLTTHFGENRNSPNYGCSIWENEFENVLSIDTVKEELRLSIKRAIDLYEKRITNVLISVELKQEQISFKMGGEFRIKRKVEISITGNLTKTNEYCTFTDKFYIGPISFD